MNLPSEPDIMAHSDSEGETIDDLDFEARTTDADGEEDNEIDEDLLGALENGVEDASEVEEVGRYVFPLPPRSLSPRNLLQMIRTMTTTTTTTTKKWPHNRQPRRIRLLPPPRRRQVGRHLHSRLLQIRLKVGKHRF